VDGDALNGARDLLSESQADLFLSMPRRDQRHALEVARRLRHAGVEDPDLLTAALLHDCGKGDVPVWLRILNVVGPRLVHCVAALDRKDPRGAAYRLAHHEALSATAAAAYGCSPTTVRLIGGKPAEAERDLFALLLAADDAS
jgi:hypothetical protein